MTTIVNSLPHVQTEITDEMISKAKKNGTRDKSRIFADSVRYIRGERVLALCFRNGTEIRIPIDFIKCISHLPDNSLEHIRLCFLKSSICLDEEDVHVSISDIIAENSYSKPIFKSDLHVPALSRFIFGSEAWTQKLPEKIHLIEQKNELSREHHKNYNHSNHEAPTNIMENYFSIIWQQHNTARNTIFKTVFSETRKFSTSNYAPALAGKLCRAGVKETKISSLPEEKQDQYKRLVLKSGTIHALSLSPGCRFHEWEIRDFHSETAVMSSPTIVGLSWLRIDKNESNDENQKYDADISKIKKENNMLPTFNQILH
jgi:hypothetical protein